ncbi:hypothetical protein VTO42DRAFT_6814 [Malbranchea cinnamomea]
MSTPAGEGNPPAYDSPVAAPKKRNRPGKRQRDREARKRAREAAEGSSVRSGSAGPEPAHQAQEPPKTAPAGGQQAADLLVNASCGAVASPHSPCPDPAVPKPAQRSASRGTVSTPGQGSKESERESQFPSCELSCAPNWPANPRGDNFFSYTKEDDRTKDFASTGLPPEVVEDFIRQDDWAGSDSQTHVQKLERRLMRAKELLQAQNENLRQYDATLAEVKRQKKDADYQLYEAKKWLMKAAAQEKEVEDLRAKLSKYETEITSHDNQQRAAEKDGNEANRLVDELQHQLKKSNDTLWTVEQERGHLAEELRKATEMVADLSKERNGMKREGSSKDRQIERLREEIDDLKQTNEHYVRMVKNLEVERDAFAEAIKASPLEAENDLLRAELEKAHSDLVRVNQTLQDVELELAVERRAHAPITYAGGCARLSTDLRQHAGSDSDDSSSRGEGAVVEEEKYRGTAVVEVAGDHITEERKPLVIFRKRSASVPSVLARSRLTTSAATQTEAGLAVSASVQTDGIPTAEACAKTDETEVDYLDINTQTDEALIVSTSAQTWEISAVEAETQTDDTEAVSKTAQPNQVSVAEASVRTDEVERPSRPIETERSLSVESGTQTEQHPPTTPEMRDAAMQTDAQIPASTRKRPLNTFLKAMFWLLLLLSILFVVMLVGEKYRDWTRANGYASL